MGADIDTGALLGSAEGSDFGADEPIQQPEGQETDASYEGSEGAEEYSAEGEQPETESTEQATPEREALPAEIAKAIREIKQASPEHSKALKSLGDAYYAARGYKQIYPTVEEAQSAKSTLDAIGGPEGIVSMRNDIKSLEEFDNMASEGDPGVINALAEQFPDGFKKIVPAALERLQQMDVAAFRETLRGPLLQMMEGDGLIETIGSAIEELRGGNPDRAQRELNRVAQWWNQLKQQETETRNRYKDPRVEQLASRERNLREQQSNLMRQHVTRELNGYLSSSMSEPLNTVLKGQKLSAQAVEDLKEGIVQEIHRMLGASELYRRSVSDLMSQGDIDKVVAFAKPHIDAARRKAINTVYTRRYGTMPAPRRQTATAADPSSSTPAPARKANQPVILARKPSPDDIDFSRDPGFKNYVTGRAYLKNGKFVTWKNQ